MNLQQIAENGKLSIIVGSTLSQENPWKVLSKAILSMLLNGQYRDFVQELEEKNINTEAFFRALYQVVGEKIFSILNGFVYSKPDTIHCQLASLATLNKVSLLGTTSIDNRFSLAFSEKSSEIFFLNGEINNTSSLKDSLSYSDKNLVCLSPSAENFFKKIKTTQGVLVLGLQPGDYCWQAVYGRIVSLAKEMPVYWIANKGGIRLQHLARLPHGNWIEENPKTFLTDFLKKWENTSTFLKKWENTSTVEHPDEVFTVPSNLANLFSQNQKIYFIALLLKLVMSRSHSLTLFQKLLEIHQKLNEEAGMALCFRNIAQIFFEQGYVEKSIEYHRISISYWTKIGQKEELAKEYMLLAENYLSGSSLEQAVRNYQEALELYQQENKPKEIAEIASKLGFICDEDNDYELSKKYYQRSWEAIQKCSNSLEEILILLNFSTNFVKDKNWIQAKQQLEIALALSFKESETFYLGEIYQHLGLVYMNLQDYSHAREYYEKASEFYSKNEEKISLTFVYCNLGHVCVRLEDYDSAIKYYESALETYEKMGDWQHLAAIYNNLGFVNSTRQNLSLAEDYFSRAAEIFAALGDVYNLIRTHSNLGKIYTAQGEIENAIECYRANIEMLTQLREEEDLAATLVTLGMIQLQSSRFPDSLKQLEQAVEIYQRLGMNLEKEETLKIIETIKNNIASST